MLIVTSISAFCHFIFNVHLFFVWFLLFRICCCFFPFRFVLLFYGMVRVRRDRLSSILPGTQRKGETIKMNVRNSAFANAKQAQTRREREIDKRKTERIFFAKDYSLHYVQKINFFPKKKLANFFFRRISGFFRIKKKCPNRDEAGTAKAKRKKKRNIILMRQAMSPKLRRCYFVRSLSCCVVFLSVVVFFSRRLFFRLLQIVHQHNHRNHMLVLSHEIQTCFASVWQTVCPALCVSFIERCVYAHMYKCMRPRALVRIHLSIFRVNIFQTKQRTTFVTSHKY